MYTNHNTINTPIQTAKDTTTKSLAESKIRLLAPTAADFNAVFVGCALDVDVKSPGRIVICEIIEGIVESADESEDVVDVGDPTNVVPGSVSVESVINGVEDDVGTAIDEVTPAGDVAEFATELLVLDCAVIAGTVTTSELHNERYANPFSLANSYLKSERYTQLTRPSALDIVAAVGDAATAQLTQLCRVLAT